MPSSRNAEPCDHVVQPYTDDTFLARVVADYIASGLAQGDAVITIATLAHTRAFTARLAATGIDVSAVVGARHLLTLDAEHTLAGVMVDGRPERTPFRSRVTAALDRVHVRDGHAIRLYGELVDLLWQEQLEAALTLEGLWNELLADGRLSLFCAYRLDPLDRHGKGVLRRITHCHSRLMPADEPERFEAAVDRAYAEVFGAGGDVATLRALMVSRLSQGPAVPPAHAALFALDDMPPLIANDIRARARQYYRRPTAGPLPPRSH